MIASLAPRPVRHSHRVGLVAASLLALAFALASCASPLSSKAVGSHSCSDKVASAFVTGVAPPKACMSADLQTLDWASGKPFASSSKYLGESDDQGSKAELYDLTFSQQTADSGKGMLLVIWVDAKGVVQGIGISYRLI